MALYDTVLARGRVLDPESGLDGVRDVALKGGRIVAISEAELSAQAAATLDCAGLVVAPGFIDLHSHGMKACDAELMGEHRQDIGDRGCDEGPAADDQEGQVVRQTHFGTGKVAASWLARGGGVLLHAWQFLEVATVL